MPLSLLTMSQRLRAWVAQLGEFPWRSTALMLRERYREDRLGVTAASLTFTTLLALVPFVTVALALFTAFPIFSKMQSVLQTWLMASLVPESISRPVMGYLTQFAAKAGRLGGVGFSFLMVTALSLILTMDRTLNAIWRVRRLRPLGQRVLIYWAAISLGPLVLAVSLALTASMAATVSRGLGAALPGGARFLLDALEFLIMAGGMAALFRYVPNTQVHWRHAWAGGLFVALGMELAKKVLGLYLASVPTYSVIYGTFATVPILLLWIYVAWIIVLLGAVVAAYLPSVLAGVARQNGGRGWPFALALQVLQRLHAARQQPAHGLTAMQLARGLGVAVLQLEQVLDALIALGWVVQVNEAVAGAPDSADARLVLLVDPAATPAQPLVQSLLLERSGAIERFWEHAGIARLTLAELFARA